MDAVEHVFTHYAVFEGRARRSEFWYFQLFHFVVMFVLGALSVIGFLAVLFGLYMLASLISNIAVSRGNCPADSMLPVLVSGVSYLDLSANEV